MKAGTRRRCSSLRNPRLPVSALVFLSGFTCSQLWPLLFENQHEKKTAYYIHILRAVPQSERNTPSMRRAVMRGVPCLSDPAGS
jgi:hypothetical protein